MHSSLHIWKIEKKTPFLIISNEQLPDSQKMTECLTIIFGISPQKSDYCWQNQKNLYTWWYY